MTLTRRRFLAAAGGAAALCAGSGLTVPADASPSAPRTADEARRAGWTVVTDHGAVGDGRSRPLRDRYPTLAAARRDLPSATDLDAELDGVVIQSVTDAGAARIFYPPGHYLHSAAVIVRDRQRHVGAGPDTLLENVRPRADSYDWAQAHSFQVGDVHPVAMQADRVGVGWAVRPLDPIAAGDRSVTLRAPLGAVPLRVGDVVMIRCDNTPFVDGEGLTYDFEMWNRVTRLDGDRIALEDPVPRAIAATGSATELHGPTLCVNAGGDYFIRQPWTIAQNVEIGSFTLDSAGFAARTAVWRGWFHDLALTAQHMLSLNAVVHTVVERVTGTFSARLMEVKQASRATTVRDVSGTFRRGDNTVAPVMQAIDVGEQSFDCTFDGISCVVGPEHTAAVRTLELSSPGLSFRGTLDYRGTGRVGEVWAVKDSNGPASPPTGIALDVVVRARSGLRSYGIVGNAADRVSDPADLTLRLDQRSYGAPPRHGLAVERGRGIRVLDNRGDSPTAGVSPFAEAPSGIPLA